MTAGFLAGGCTIFSTRPDRQLAYAEAAYYSAGLANAESLASPIYATARDSLYRARSEYRKKNFKDARTLANRARRLSEEAEMRALSVERLGDTAAAAAPAIDPTAAPAKGR